MIIEKNDVKTVFPERARDMHKGGAGRVLLVAGSPGMAGCAVLSTEAALRTGSGLVYVCTPKGNQQIVNTRVPEAVCVEWTNAIKHLSGQFGDTGAYCYDAVAFGPGAGTGTSARRMLKTLLLSYDGTVIIDADGLTILSSDREIAELTRGYSGEIVITPHPGEAARLLPEFEGEREDMVRALSVEYGTISILKGHETLMAVPKGDMTLGEGTVDADIFLNPTGNPGMASAGSGDVLTGVILSLCGQGNLPKDAARAGVFLHGLAGDLAADDKGEYGMIAGDIVHMLPYAIKEIQK